MARVYLDTSFFVGLLENQDNRQDEARKIVNYEKQNDRFTSILTLNEFLVRVYDQHKRDANCEELLRAIELRIRSIARVVALSEEVAREAARLQSIYGEVQGQAAPREPRDRKFRWDAIHIATAQTWKCDRIYAWDGKWARLPDDVKRGLGEIIAPAVCPGLPFEPPPAAAPPTEEV